MGTLGGKGLNLGANITNCSPVHRFNYISINYVSINFGN